MAQGRTPRSPLGEFLDAELRARGWNNSDLAERCGRSPSTVSRWRNGHNPPSAQNCGRIAEAFGVEPDVVLRLAGHLPPIVEQDTPHDAWSEQIRMWSSRFDRGVRALSQPDDCAQRTVDAWLDGFTLLMSKLGASV